MPGVETAPKEPLKQMDINVARTRNAPALSPWIAAVLPPKNAQQPTSTTDIKDQSLTERQLMPPPATPPKLQLKPTSNTLRGSPLAIKNIQDKIVNLIRQFITAVQGMSSHRVIES